MPTCDPVLTQIPSLDELQRREDNAAAIAGADADALVSPAPGQPAAPSGTPGAAYSADRAETEADRAAAERAAAQTAEQRSQAAAERSEQYADADGPIGAAPKKVGGPTVRRYSAKHWAEEARAAAASEAFVRVMQRGPGTKVVVGALLDTAAETFVLYPDPATAPQGRPAAGQRWIDASVRPQTAAVVWTSPRVPRDGEDEMRLAPTGPTGIVYELPADGEAAEQVPLAVYVAPPEGYDVDSVAFFAEDAATLAVTPLGTAAQPAGSYVALSVGVDALAAGTYGLACTVTISPTAGGAATSADYDGPTVEVVAAGDAPVPAPGEPPATVQLAQPSGTVTVAETALLAVDAVVEIGPGQTFVSLQYTAEPFGSDGVVVATVAADEGQTQALPASLATTAALAGLGLAGDSLLYADLAFTYADGSTGTARSASFARLRVAEAGATAIDADLLGLTFNADDTVEASVSLDPRGRVASSPKPTAHLVSTDGATRVPSDSGAWDAFDNHTFTWVADASIPDVGYLEVSVYSVEGVPNVQRFPYENPVAAYRSA